MERIINTYMVLRTYTYRKETKYKVKCLICGKCKSLSESELDKPCTCVKTDDTVGHTYGSLFVYSKYMEQQKVYCKCVCQLCGNTTVVLKSNLTRGHTKSCGCLKQNDLTGKVFGSLSVAKKEIKDGKTYYYCLCRLCGRTVLKRADVIPQLVSCGCDKKENRIQALKENVFIDGTQPSKIKLDKKPTKANKSGIIGVYWDKSRGKWKADIKFKSKKYNLGRFEFIEDAIEARKEAEKRIFGDFIEWYESQKSKKSPAE